MKQIILISGSGGVGKDRFVRFCSKYIPTLNISSVDKVKKAAKILGWDGKTKDEKTRLFLARLKFDSSDYNDQPYDYIKSCIEKYRINEFYKVMFIHIREPKEIDKVKNDFSCKTLLIRNINVKDIKSNEADANVENYTYDYVIDNNYDLKSLNKKAYEFIDELTKED